MKEIQHGLPGLKAACDKAETNIFALAKKLQLSAPHLYGLAAGKRQTTETVLRQIAKELNCSTDDLLGLAEEVA